ncbi:MAG TPA: DUF134 domain-containing protein [Tepidimicrobium sp.]|nr:DUF134 domain-containing protein [Tepidimicrobium sp.]
MGRPIKSRKVEFVPHIRRFTPSKESSTDIQNYEAEGICLKLEELESMRLRDIEGLTQQECADTMGISRQTFQNIIATARKKVTTALLEGKALSIRGGNYRFDFCRLRCKSCNRVYEIEYMRDRNICPICSSQRVVCKRKTEECTDWCSK